MRKVCVRERDGRGKGGGECASVCARMAMEEVRLALATNVQCSYGVTKVNTTTPQR